MQNLWVQQTTCSNLTAAPPTTLAPKALKTPWGSVVVDGFKISLFSAWRGEKTERANPPVDDNDTARRRVMNYSMITFCVSSPARPPACLSARPPALPPAPQNPRGREQTAIGESVLFERCSAECLICRSSTMATRLALSVTNMNLSHCTTVCVFVCA